MNRVVPMNRSIVLRAGAAATLAACAIAAAGTAGGSDFAPPADGWASWQVPAVAGAPDWCCFDWRHKGEVRSSTCKLDERSDGYGSRDGRTVDAMRIYARFERGELRRIRALGPACPVEANSAIADLGEISPDAGARWLIARIGSDRDTASDTLAALAAHAGRVARDGLIAIARSDRRQENRKDAVFWIGQLRASDSADELEAIMFEDADPELREHAAFSLSQSDVPDRAAALIRLGRTDREPKVRGQAWFWLAQTGAPESEAAIAQAMSAERDNEVREQAIFALSQLPGERAVAALGAILKDPHRSRAERKRALFWLGQSDSPQAQRYLADVLEGS